MLRIENVEVSGLDSAVVASGYPLADDSYTFDVNMDRAKKLGAVLPGSGPDCFLKGIVVMFDVIFPEYWSPQFQRYHFADIISSQSKMHRITRLDIKSNCNKYVDDDVIKKIEEYKNEWKNANTKDSKYFWFMKIVSNLPMGFEKRMRIVTNYLQLKQIFKQRNNHKLKEDWGAFTDWVLTLPKFKVLTGYSEKTVNVE